MFERLRDPQVAITVAGTGAASAVAGVGLLALNTGVNDRFPVGLIVAGAAVMVVAFLFLWLGPSKRQAVSQPEVAVRAAVRTSQQSGGMAVGVQNVGVQTNNFGGIAQSVEPPVNLEGSVSSDGQNGFVIVENPGAAESFCLRIRSFDATNPSYELRGHWSTGDEERRLKMGERDWCLVIQLEPERIFTRMGKDGQFFIPLFKSTEFRQQQARYASGDRRVRFVGNPHSRDLEVSAQGREYSFKVAVLSDRRKPVEVQVSYAVVGDTLVLPFDRTRVEALLAEQRARRERLDQMLSKSRIGDSNNS
jgi:hypothetical protein